MLHAVTLPLIGLVACAVFILIKVNSEAIPETLDEDEDIQLFTPHARTNNSTDVTIAIIIERSFDRASHKTALNSLECYSAFHGYQLIVEYDDRFHECAKHKDKFFRRHCHTHQIMQNELSEDSWIFSINPDNGIINPNRLIEQFIDLHYDIYLQTRPFSWEVSSQYLIRNNERGRSFVKNWSEYEFKLPDSFHGSDTGVLQIMMMEFLMPNITKSSKFAQECASIWERSRNAADLSSAMACTRMMIGEKTNFPAQRVKIFPKTEGWSQEPWQLHSHWSTDNFMMTVRDQEDTNNYKGCQNLNIPRRFFRMLRRSLLDPATETRLPFEGQSACHSSFPLMNKLDVAKCREGSEVWTMDKRLRIDNTVRRAMLMRISDRILRLQVDAMISSSGGKDTLL